MHLSLELFTWQFICTDLREQLQHHVKYIEDNLDSFQHIIASGSFADSGVLDVQVGTCLGLVLSGRELLVCYLKGLDCIMNIFFESLLHLGYPRFNSARW